jgi:hypothetical protein
MSDTLFLTLCCLAWLYLSILVHAFVEVMAGKLVGLKFQKMRVGSSDWKWRVTLGGVRWQFHPIPFGVYGYLKSWSMEKLRWKIPIMCLTVLAANVAMVWIFIKLWPMIEGPDAHYEGETSPFLVYTAALRIIDVLFQLLPTAVVVDGLYAPTLGKLFVEGITGAYPSSWGPIFYVWETYPKMVAPYEPGVEFETSWLATTTLDNWNLLISAEVDSGTGQHEAAIEKWEKVLANPNLKGGERARILDHLASTFLQDGSKPDLQKGLEWTREAQALVPQARTIRATHGALLVETGAFAEAIEMLTPLTTPNCDETDRVISSLFLAKACDRQGDAHQAALWLFRAGRHEAYEKLRSRIISELSPEAQAEVV